MVYDGYHSRSSAATNACRAAARGRWSRPSRPASAPGRHPYRRQILPASWLAWTFDVVPGCARGTRVRFFSWCWTRRRAPRVAHMRRVGKARADERRRLGVGFFDGAIFPRRWRSPARCGGRRHWCCVVTASPAVVLATSVGGADRSRVNLAATDTLLRTTVVDRAVAGPAAESVQTARYCTSPAHGLDVWRQHCQGRRVESKD